MNSYFKNSINFFLLVVFMLLLISCEKSIYQEKEKPELIISAGNHLLSESTIHFHKDTVYVIATNLVRNAGQRLIIDAGVLIKMGNKLSVTINKGAVIEANGTVDAPIVFTSATATGRVGVIGSGGSGSNDNYWYGLRVYGNSLGQPVSSGKLNYVRIEFAGGNESFGGLPSVLFNNVYHETAIDNIQVSYSYSNLVPSFEFSGGDCNASHLVSYASSGNDFYLSNGYKGKLQHIVAYRHPIFPSEIFSPSQLVGLHIDGKETFPSLSNVTVLGPDNQKSTSLAYTQRPLATALLVTNDGRFSIRNSVFAGFPIGGFFLNSTNSAKALNNDISEFSSSIVHSTDSNKAFILPTNIFPPYGSADFQGFILNPRLSNELYKKFEIFKLVNPFDYSVNPDPTPMKESAILTGSNFTGPVFSDPFFKAVAYRGAWGTENWMNGWTNFHPLQTNYNN